MEGHCIVASTKRDHLLPGVACVDELLNHPLEEVTPEPVPSMYYDILPLTGGLYELLSELILEVPSVDCTPKVVLKRCTAFVSVPLY